MTPMKCEMTRDRAPTRERRHVGYVLTVAATDAMTHRLGQAWPRRVYRNRRTRPGNREDYQVQLEYLAWVLRLRRAECLGE